MKIRAMRVVCLVRGHRWGDIATRLLGVCDRCHFPFDGRLHGPGCVECDRGVTEFHRSRTDEPNPLVAPEKPCAGKGSNVCAAEGCFGESCVREAVTE
jgi:hypothetical protein